jgi:hypothetical protein
VKKLQPPRDLIEALGETYELLLENALKKAKQSGIAMHQIMSTVRDDAVALHKFSDDEAIKLEAYIKRDLVDAAQYLNKTGKKLEGWVGFDVALVKREFWEYFAEAADQTTIELNQLTRQAQDAGYHSGELIGLGTLVCDQCGEKMHFHKPAPIPSCPKCNNAHFHRQRFE